MGRAVDIGGKLELTATATGCLTRKELCAAFARINPNTLLTLQNSYNWIRGRSTPRSFSLYEDWATLLQLPEGPHFIMSSSLQDFARVVGERFDLPEALLKPLGVERHPPSPSSGSAHGNGCGAWSNQALIEGSFLSLSLAWSPTQPGRLLIGSARFGNSDGVFSLRYLERILGNQVVFQGPCSLDSRSGQAILRCTANDASFFMSFHLPSVPGNLAGGIFAGNAVYDPDTQASASPILFVRNHALKDEELEAELGYQALEPPVIAASLQALGYGSDTLLEAEQALLYLLRDGAGGPLLKLDRAAVIRAAALLDQRRLLTLEDHSRVGERLETN